MSEPFGIEIAVRACEIGFCSTEDAKAVAARLRERTSKLAKATERIAALEAEIARLRESLAIFVHAHSTGNSVPPNIEAKAMALVKKVGR